MGWDPRIHPQRKRGRIVGYTFRCGGIPYYIPGPLRSARAAAAEIRAAYLRKQAPAVAQPEFVPELVERWLQQWPKRKWTIEAWAQHAPETALDEITPDHLELYAKQMKADGYSLWVVKERVNYAHMLCRWAHDQGWMDRVPRRPKIHAPKYRPRDIPRTSLRRILDGVPGTAGRLLRFVVESGCRPKEARTLRWDQVDEWGDAVQEDHKTKQQTGTDRRIPITRAARAVLDGIPRTSEWVFPSRLGRPYTQAGLRSVLRKHSPGITSYQFRHTFAQALADSDLSDGVIAEMLGHSGLSMVRRYREIRQARLNRAAASLISVVPDVPAVCSDDAGNAPSPSASPPPIPPLSTGPIS